MAEYNLTLIQKLAKIRTSSDVVKKNKKGYGYTYADITEILANITAGMKKHGVSLIPTIVPNTASVEQTVSVNTKINKNTNEAYDVTTTEMLFTAQMIFKWVNDDNPDDFIEVPWFVAGAQADPSQAMGSGLTYTMRQFLTNYFQIAQSDNDVDAYRSKQKAAEASEDRAIAEQIIQNFDVVVRQFLADNSDKAEDVKKFIGRYAKGGNYKLINEPSLAAKLFENFKKNFIKGE